MNIEGIVLAAGLSSRAGTYKMALDFHGKTVIENCICGMYDFCSRIIVVGGYRAENLKRVLDNYPKAELVINRGYEKGMFSSVKSGLTHIKEKRFFLTPGDYPLIGKSVYEGMLKADGDIIIPKYHGKEGHPVLMMSHIISDILADSSLTNLNSFIRSRGFKTVEVQCPGILRDIDTMEDYRSLLGLEISGEQGYGTNNNRKD